MNPAFTHLVTKAKAGYVKNLFRMHEAKKDGYLITTTSYIHP